MHKLSVLIVSLMLNGITLQQLLNSQANCWKKGSYLRNINCVNTLITALCFPSVTCCICCLEGNVDVKHSHWWWSGDGKIINVAEEKFPLSEISDNTTMLIKARKHLEQWDSCLRNKDIYLYFSKITTKDNQALRMWEHLETKGLECDTVAYLHIPHLSLL